MSTPPTPVGIRVPDEAVAVPAQRCVPEPRPGGGLDGGGVSLSGQDARAQPQPTHQHRTKPGAVSALGEVSIAVPENAPMIKT